MKKIFCIIIATSLLVSSCSKMLDIEPTDAISNEEAIKDKAGVEKAITGAYDVLQNIGLYGRNRVILGDLAADNVSWTGTTLDYAQVDNNQVPIDNSLIEGMWSGAYDGINRVNNILYALPGIGGITDNERKTYEGHALFIRALLHFNLLTYFGGVPVKTSPTLDLASVDVPRNTVAEVFDRVILDLQEAETRLPGPGQVSEGRANAFSATALLARVYLTRFHAEDNPAMAGLAVEKADLVIQQGGFSLAAGYDALFSGGSAERIFQVSFSVQDRNRLAEYYFPRSLTGRYEIGPSTAFIESWDPADSLRFKATIAFDSLGTAYGFKYRKLSEGSDPVLVIRLAEMYLVKAEALAYNNGDMDVIRDNINTVRSRAGLPPVIDQTYPELRLAVERERRYEFAQEGHRWFDLVRTKRAVAVLGIDPNFTLFPIPLSEMTTNSRMEQNPGY